MIYDKMMYERFYFKVYGTKVTMDEFIASGIYENIVMETFSTFDEMVNFYLKHIADGWKGLSVLIAGKMPYVESTVTWGLFDTAITYTNYVEDNDVERVECYDVVFKVIGYTNSDGLKGEIDKEFIDLADAFRVYKNCIDWDVIHFVIEFTNDKFKNVMYPNLKLTSYCERI
jgi:hypothetical protein